MPCRLLLVDDHPALLHGLAGLLGQEPDMEVVGQVGSGEALLALLPTLAAPADVLLLDLHLPPPLDGLHLLPILARDWPRLRVLVFSSASSPSLAAQVAAAGAYGFLDKSVEASVLLAAIRTVCDGEKVFPGRRPPRFMPAQPLQELPTEAGARSAEVLLRVRQLSAREREILGLVREGLSTHDIAQRLSLSEFTISTHRRNLMQKLGVRKLAELLRFAYDFGL